MTPTLTTTWNTGRLYTHDGQPMAAGVFPGEDSREDAVVFVDHGRGIFGEFKLYRHPGNEAEFRSLVMRAYDHNQWKGAGIWDERVKLLLSLPHVPLAGAVVVLQRR